MATHLVTKRSDLGSFGFRARLAHPWASPMGSQEVPEPIFEDAPSEIIGQELIRGSPGSRGSSGSGVRSRGSDPPFHAPGSQDDVSSQANSLKSSRQSPNILASQDNWPPTMLARPGSPRDPKLHLFVTKWVAMAPFETWGPGPGAESRQGGPAPSIPTLFSPIWSQ